MNRMISSTKTPPKEKDPLAKPNAAIGFTAIFNGAPEIIARAQQAMDQALSYFHAIKQVTVKIGQTALWIWGREPIDQSYHQLGDGSLVLVIGSRPGHHTWQSIEDRILSSSHPDQSMVDWDGRAVLLRLDPNQNTWMLWNDWVGSIPVFHANTSSGVIASTLEPAVVNALRFSAEDIFLPSLISMLINGHYFSDWTLFKNMKVVPPDCKAIWDRSGFHSIAVGTIQPSTERWDRGWNDLIDEMHAFSKKAIATTLDTHPQWILPLSSGLDSRLIACVAAELNKNVTAYTWGTPRSNDVVHAKKIARSLGIPWKHMDLGNTYLGTYKQQWIHMFGSAMHFHGMYQMPFLNNLESEPAGPILSGFLGECLSGYGILLVLKPYSESFQVQILPDDWIIWQIAELRQLFSTPIESALEELATEFKKRVASLSGALYQRLNHMLIVERLHHFTYFSSMLFDYWRGDATPYINRDYANFSFSLPRAVMDQRELQQAMLRRYYPKIAAIPGTYAPVPALLTGSYLLKKRIAKHIPGSTAIYIFPDVFRIRSNSEVECVKNIGTKAFGALFDRLELLQKWVNRETIEATYHNIMKNNDTNSVTKLLCIETLAYRLSNPSNE